MGDPDGTFLQSQDLSGAHDADYSRHHLYAGADRSTFEGTVSFFEGGTHALSPRRHHFLCAPSRGESLQRAGGAPLGGGAAHLYAVYRVDRYRLCEHVSPGEHPDEGDGGAPSRVEPADAVMDSTVQRQQVPVAR